MKILHLNISNNGDGASRAAYRLHDELRMSGINSQMLVHAKRGDSSSIALASAFDAKFEKVRPFLSRLPLKFYLGQSTTEYSLAWLPDLIESKVRHLAPDIINLHWIGGGYMNINTLSKLKKPILWTCHDMWAFTGGCHYSGNCDRYTQSCGACPNLQSKSNWDVSRLQWQSKVKAWKSLNMTLVTPSHWLGDCARASSLFKTARIEVIPNGLDLQQYRPIEKRLARQLLGLPQDKFLVLFGAVQATSDKRKGFHQLQVAIQELSQAYSSEEMELLIFGASTPKEPAHFGLPVRYLGMFNDDIALTLLYSAADVFVAPSLEDNLPNTIVESIACGTPCVGFKIGGIPDIIDHEKNGYLARPYETSDLAHGIKWVIADQTRHQHLCNNARAKAESEFSISQQVKRYTTLFEELVA